MIYHLLWKRYGKFGSGTVHTWDDKVTDTTPALEHLVGKPYTAVAATAARLGANMVLENDGQRIVLRRMVVTGPGNYRYGSLE